MESLAEWMERTRREELERRKAWREEYERRWAEALKEAVLPTDVDTVLVTGADGKPVERSGK